MIALFVTVLSKATLKKDCYSVKESFIVFLLNSTFLAVG